MILYSLFFLSFICTASAAVCTDPWMPIGDYCYLFAADKVAWDNARSLCVFSGGDLVVFDLTCEDYSEIFHHADTLGMSYPWIGASDASVEGYWEWTDGRPMDLRKNYWSKTQPFASNVYNCANMMADSYNRWELLANKCTDARDFICQKASEETNMK